MNYHRVNAEWTKNCLSALEVKLKHTINMIIYIACYSHLNTAFNQFHSYPMLTIDQHTLTSLEFPGISCTGVLFQIFRNRQHSCMFPVKNIRKCAGYLCEHCLFLCIRQPVMSCNVRASSISIMSSLVIYH